jgi:hypothetical protein
MVAEPGARAAHSICPTALGVNLSICPPALGVNRKIIDARSLVGKRRTYPAPPGQRGGVGSMPANSDAQNVPSFRRWRFEMKPSPFL